MGEPAPERYSLRADGDALLFEVEGAGREMPWQITFRQEEIASDARCLVIRYRAEGLSEAPGNYFLHGWEGTAGGKATKRAPTGSGTSWRWTRRRRSPPASSP